MAKSIIYHGGYCEIASPDILKGKHAKDFGDGFYCTVIREQAQRWAKRYDTPMLNSYSYFHKDELSVKEFKDMTEEWLSFIIDCRSGKEHDYDIVIGAMANDQIYNYISDYMEGTLTKEQFWVLAKFKYPTHQIAFTSPASLKCLEFIKSEVLV